MLCNLLGVNPDNDYLPFKSRADLYNMLFGELVDLKLPVRINLDVLIFI